MVTGSRSCISCASASVPGHFYISLGAQFSALLSSIMFFVFGYLWSRFSAEILWSYEIASCELHIKQTWHHQGVDNNS